MTRFTNILARGIGLTFVVVLVQGCLRDFGQFEEQAASTAAGGHSGSGGLAAGGEDTGGAPHEGGVCGTAEKMCATGCVPTDAPETGCGDEACDACPPLPHQTSVCQSGLCDAGSCQVGFMDCDGDLATGCEHGESTFSAQQCGGCGADCTSLGLTDCQDARCGCVQDAQCEGNARAGDFLCRAGSCECSGQACGPGETCRRAGNAAECTCGGSDACATGRVCCPSTGGATCTVVDGTDEANCGACGLECPEAASCVRGTCVENN